MAQMGGGLAGAANEEVGEAQRMLGSAADQEQQRVVGNRQMERQRKQGNVTLGATGGAMLGAYYGSSLGPWGTLIGGALGAIAGGLF